MPQEHTEWDIAVLGGAGRVGLPLSIALADRGAKVVISDTSEAAVAKINAGELPFREDGAAAALHRALAADRLVATTDPSVVARCATLIVVLGTPVDAHLNPDPQSILRALESVTDHLHDGQLLILRSTVYPGVTERLERSLAEQGLDVDVAFCPERIAEGAAMTELFSLPQLVGSSTEQGRKRAAEVFRTLTDHIVELTPEEAELAKLFTNNWRYLKFAAANQFYMIASSRGLDFTRIRAALMDGYPRAQDLPGAGFAAGPCLFKDTMQLAAFNDNNYFLGHAAMLVNEGLPLHVVQLLAAEHDLSNLTVGILGMAFKAESDDTRESLSYKLKRILTFQAKRVLCTDPYVTSDPSLVPLETVLAEADLLVVGAPHAIYRELRVEQPVADVWGILQTGQHR